MRRFVIIAVIALIALILAAGCTIGSDNEPEDQTPAPTVSIPPTTEIPTTTITPTMTETAVPTPDPLGDSPTLVTVSAITGVSGTKSVNVSVPYASWEMWYTADPISTGGQDSHSSTGSNSAVFPSLSIVVRDAATGDEIETVEPPGGLDTTLWQRRGDPRPWSKKFYQGYKNYTFDITARHIKSYLIEVRVPK